MKIEASEGAYGEGGAVVCSVAELLPAIAQDGQASIGLRQQQPGCGPADGPFDCEHFQFIDDSDAEEDEATAAMSHHGLKSLLKRGRSGHGRSVTFDEAVTLYCDDGEGVQLLQLTTGPDIVAAVEAYYGMFEPPIEYQDIEPPAEYRDQDEEEPPEPAPAVEEPPPPVVVEEETPPEEEEEVVVEKVEVEVEPPPKEEVMEEDPLPSPNESDKLIERFLEAEGVFPVDEELNSVFRELHSDFMGDGQNGALDDTLFRNLISFLSNAEEIPLEAGDFFSTTKFEDEDVTPTPSEEVEEDAQAHSRTLSEADSDCSISSQDTIIVRLGEEEGDQQQQQQSERSGKVAERVKAFESQVAAKPFPEPRLLLHKQESLDEVFSERCTHSEADQPIPPPPRPLPRESLQQKIQQVVGAGEESLSRQSSGETSVTDPPADADDSTSSDSRSGEVEEEMRLDDIGYDEEDADDYDEESFRGMAHGNSKIRRIIKKNALQCTLFRGIEAKRRQQPGIKYPRPKSPLLSQESLVEKLKWLTTVDEPKEGDVVNFHSKPPDVILSTGGIPVNGSISHGGSEDNVHSAMSYPQQFYQMQRFAMNPNAKGGYYVRHDGYHPSLPRPRMAACPGGHPLPPPPPGWRMMAPWVDQQQQQQQQQPPQQQQQTRSIGSLTVPRNFRDWRVIQRVMVGRSSSGSDSSQRTGGAVPADYVRCAPATANGAPRTTRDELEQFVEQDSQRLDRIRKRYSVAEDDDDPTFGFARRPSVRGVQGRIQTHPSEQPPIPEEARYGTWGGGRPEYRAGPMHIHRASVALTELPGNATIPYAHRKHPDPRYHSYAESMYGSTRTLPAKTWDPRMLQVVLPPPAKDERGVPEGASSSPKISSDSLYHSPVVPDPMPPGGPQPHKDEGVIYYSLNV